MKIIKELNLFLPVLATEEEIDLVNNFFCFYKDFRLLPACAKATGLSIYKCARIKKYLYKHRIIGLYYFGLNQPPHKYMKQYIVEKFPDINGNTLILEVGPGQNPIFSQNEYKNWYAVDKYFENGIIYFKENLWNGKQYSYNKIIKGSYENLTEVFADTNLVGKFDLVVGSHSYEHTLLPIHSLIEAGKMLRSGGLLALFVPDGFSDDFNAKDPTHTLYLNHGMIKEFFVAAGGFKDVIINSFRPNADLIITAIKI